MRFQRSDKLKFPKQVGQVIHRLGRTLTVRVDKVVEADSDMLPESTIEAYVGWLELWTSSLRALRRIGRDDARRVCEVCCAYDIAYERRRLSSEDASDLAGTWLAVWSPSCLFFSNVANDPSHASEAVLQLAATPAVFFEDISLGVIAVDHDSVGLFYYHSSS